VVERLTISVDYRPREQFREFHARTQRFGCIVAHRRCGKTVACVADLMLAALDSANPRSRYAYIAPLYKQAKDIAWPYIKDFVRGFRAYASISETELKVALPNGASVRLYGADNPDSLRGIYLDGVVLDEYALIDVRLWPEVIRPALADRQGSAVFIGTPRGRDAFYSIWRAAQREPDLWFTVMLKASETGILPAAELKQARRHMSGAQYAREFECSFDEPDVDQFISSVALDQALARDAPALGPRLIGVDVARFGDDRSVIVKRNGDRLVSVDAYRGLDLMEVTGRVTQTIDRFRPDGVFVDAVGMGAGVVDRLRQLQYGRIFEVNAGAKPRDGAKFANKRAEMWSTMRDWLQDRGGLAGHGELADDLLSLTYGFDHANRLKLEAKKDLKARGLPSPDLADALALTFAEAIAPTDLRASYYWDKAAPETSPFAEL
jgi:hypothetical protein